MIIYIGDFIVLVLVLLAILATAVVGSALGASDYYKTKEVSRIQEAGI